MLRWRLLLGTLIVAALVGFCWLDVKFEPVLGVPGAPGVLLLPLALIAAILATHEVLHLAGAGNIRPSAWPVYFGNVLIVISNWFTVLLYYLSLLPWWPNTTTPALLSWLDRLQSIGAPVWGLGIGVLLVLAAEIHRYQKPGGSLANIAASVFALVYVGVMLSFAVSLRAIWGIGAVAAWIIVVKMGDSGAYAVGCLFGRHKMAPLVSPGKTIEGAVGALAFSCLGSWLAFQFVVPLGGYGVHGTRSATLGWIAFGLLVGGAGMLGDLAESLLKRDVGVKDSSTWMPGFGGVLDVLDSLLLSAPVAWICWASGLVGR
jgi:phosphatidate cytidylyltransferase